MTADSMDVDLLIVGSGIAGLYAALVAAPHRRVLLVTKAAIEESNTWYAQGGIAAALRPDDSPELHLRDTLAAGDGLCDPAAVSVLTSDAAICMEDLLSAGVPFDYEAEALAFTLEAAHGVARVVHAGGDATGRSIEQTLVARVREAGVEIWEQTFLIDVLSDGERVSGARVLRGKRTIEIRSPQTILATGGAGQLFSRTTNPVVATADGLAAAYRAGAEVADLEFVQFHPTALAAPGAPSFLISEAVRGEGGVLRDGDGRAFMSDYHPARELAPRDVVARAIHRQMAQTGAPNVWLDMTHLDAALIERRFPTIVATCRVHGIDPVTQPIPVAPAAHYMMGGVRTDTHACTSLLGLLACGEVACTGVHGANRLASNSLLEGLVFARRAVGAVLSGRSDCGADLRRGTAMRGEEALALSVGEADRAAIASGMWRDGGLVRSDESLRRMRQRLVGLTGETLAEIPAALEVQNLALVADLVTQAAGIREESRGAHFREDMPERDPQWLGRVVLSRAGTSFVPLQWPAATSAEQPLLYGAGRD